MCLGNMIKEYKVFLENLEISEVGFAYCNYYYFIEEVLVQELV